MKPQVIFCSHQPPTPETNQQICRQQILWSVECQSAKKICTPSRFASTRGASALNQTLNRGRAASLRNRKKSIKWLSTFWCSQCVHRSWWYLYIKIMSAPRRTKLHFRWLKVAFVITFKLNLHKTNLIYWKHKLLTPFLRDDLTNPFLLLLPHIVFSLTLWKRQIRK